MKKSFFTDSVSTILQLVVARGDYSQLFCKRPPSVHEKWSLTGGGRLPEKSTKQVLKCIDELII